MVVVQNKGERTRAAQTDEGRNAETGPLGIGRTTVDTYCNVAFSTRNDGRVCNRTFIFPYLNELKKLFFRIGSVGHACGDGGGVCVLGEG